jgi:hypothetical protein
VRKYILVAGIIVLFQASCVSKIKVQKEETNVFSNVSFDAVWTAALKSVAEMGYTVKEQDKNKGKNLPTFREQVGYINAQGDRKILSMNQAPRLKITVRRAEDKVRVLCQVIQPGQFIDYGNTKKAIKEFFERLNAALQSP